MIFEAWFHLATYVVQWAIGVCGWLVWGGRKALRCWWLETALCEDNTKFCLLVSGNVRDRYPQFDKPVGSLSSLLVYAKHDDGFV